ncbi:MAG TPA: efflux RND transporter periplasmic adaptor subunit [Xanthomonadaceae bacterium]|nr:efflux RND transporter periplasmic adaptor subunit [Xanthomonadaceae bacterium]
MSQSDLLSQLRIEREAKDTAPRRGRLWLGIAALAVVIVAVLVWSSGRSQARELELASAVAATGASSRSSVLDASGYVVARRQATVSSKVTGKVLEVLIEEGMYVHEGQVLARLDDTQQRAELELRRAQLGAASAQLGEIEAQLVQADADLRRQQELFDRDLGSAAGLDAVRAQAETLQARLASVRSQVEVAGQSMLLSAVSLEDTIIRAPFAGIVIAKAAQPGEMISPVSAGGGFTRTGIGTIVDMDSLEVEVDVNEAFIGRVSADMPVTATLNAYPDWKIPGAVIAVIPAADRTRATVRVRVALDVRDPRIVPDMGVRVAFLESRAPEPADPAVTGVLVPATAVVDRDGQAVVFVVEGNRVSRRQVGAGEIRGQQRLITRGVEAGQTVVVQPPADLADGDNVQRRGATRS